MYSESEIDEAVSAGILSADTASAFRQHVADSRRLPAVDEEHFRLLTGFNDIFVSIAIVLLLVAVSWIGDAVTSALAGAGVAATSWALAEYFTRKRRMALPSILLLVSFAGGVATALFSIAVPELNGTSEQVVAMSAAVVALATAGAVWLHWRRFMVPITVAVGAMALVACLAALITSAVTDDVRDIVLPWLALAGGLGVFALAMRWDMSDRTRTTRRTDVAFWLHLAAAPLIAHPIFHLIGALDGQVSAVTAVIVLALYTLFGLIALMIDRRALLVSSLAYVLYALYALFASAGAVELSSAFTALVIGSALLTLSAFWHPARRMIVSQLPADWRDRLPPVPPATMGYARPA